MKNPMNKLLRLLLVLAGGFGLTLAHAVEGEVLSPTKRQESLDKAKKLLAPREIPAPSADPFHSAAFVEAVSGVTRPPETTTSGTTTDPIRTSGPRVGRDQLAQAPDRAVLRHRCAAAASPDLCRGPQGFHPDG